jgi:prepilin-type N-terminal cleavage/methylation domain-containing protein
MTQRVNEFLNRQQRPCRRGFTLTELLVVISIIILVLALAVPIFSVLRGGRSVDAGQNVMSATLQRARSRAIGMQSRRGVFFFDDQVSGRTGMLLVKILDSTPNVLELDTPDIEPEYLPPGVGAAFLLPPPKTGAGSGTTDFRPTGLIVFDGLGRVETLTSYSPDYTAPKPPQPVLPPTALYQQYQNNIGPAMQVGATPGAPEQSQVAFVLYDRRPFAELGAPATPGIAFTQPQKDWLDQNATAIVINRYNGTLIRGE